MSSLCHTSRTVGSHSYPHIQQVHTHASGKRRRVPSTAAGAAERDYFDYYEAVGAYGDGDEGGGEGGGRNEAALRLAASLPMLQLISELRSGRGAGGPDPPLQRQPVRTSGAAAVLPHSKPASPSHFCVKTAEGKGAHCCHLTTLPASSPLPMQGVLSHAHVLREGRSRTQLCGCPLITLPLPTPLPRRLCHPLPRRYTRRKGRARRPLGCPHCTRAPSLQSRQRQRRLSCSLDQVCHMWVGKGGKGAGPGGYSPET